MILLYFFIFLKINSKSQNLKKTYLSLIVITLLIALFVVFYFYNQKQLSELTKKNEELITNLSEKIKKSESELNDLVNKNKELSENLYKQQQNKSQNVTGSSNNQQPSNNNNNNNSQPETDSKNTNNTNNNALVLHNLRLLQRITIILIIIH